LAMQAAVLLRERLDNACDRLAELDDSPGWSAEAAEELRRLATEQSCE